MTPAILVEILGSIRQGVFTPANPSVSTRLHASKFLIGSNPGNGMSLIFRDGTVSRRHAEVSLNAGTWRIRDLDSDNGLVLLRQADEPDLSAPDLALGGERVQDATIIHSLTLAIGAVVVRLTDECSMTSQAESLRGRNS